MSYRFFSLKFLTISLCLVGLFNILSLRTADAAGSVAMQAASLMKLAPQAYNMGMRNGNADKWNQYFESKSRRSMPGSLIEGASAIEAYYKWEFETFKAKWTTKRVTVQDLIGAMEYEWSATHKSSGDKIKISGVAIFELGMSGKVKNLDFYFDMAPVAKYFKDAPGLN